MALVDRAFSVPLLSNFSLFLSLSLYDNDSRNDPSSKSKLEQPVFIFYFFLFIRSFPRFSLWKRDTISIGRAIIVTSCATVRNSQRCKNDIHVVEKYKRRCVTRPKVAYLIVS